MIFCITCESSAALARILPRKLSSSGGGTNPRMSGNVVDGISATALAIAWSTARIPAAGRSSMSFAPNDLWKSPATFSDKSSRTWRASLRSLP